MRFKYIVYEEKSNYKVVIFDQITNHIDVANDMRLGNRIMSAGFLSIGSDGKIACWGDSKSLKKRANPEIDEKIITGLGELS